MSTRRYIFRPADRPTELTSQPPTRGSSIRDQCRVSIVVVCLLLVVLWKREVNEREREKENKKKNLTRAEIHYSALALTHRQMNSCGASTLRTMTDAQPLLWPAPLHLSGQPNKSVGGQPAENNNNTFTCRAASPARADFCQLSRTHSLAGWLIRVRSIHSFMGRPFLPSEAWPLI